MSKSTEYLAGLKHAESIYKQTYAARQTVDNMDDIQAHYESKLAALDSVLHAPFAAPLTVGGLAALLDFNSGICAYAAHVDRVFEIEYQQKTT
jgi:hypothetical protein